MPVTDDARMQNLGRAHAVKTARIEVIRALRSGRVSPAQLVRDVPEQLQTMFVFDFLREVPGVGLYKVRQLNARAVRDEINLAVCLGALTPFRRDWLASQLTAMPTRSLASRPQG